MGVPIVYRKSGEGSITSFDFYDIAEGTGIKTFYGLGYDNPTTDLSGALVTSTSLYSAGSSLDTAPNPHGWETRTTPSLGTSFASVIAKTFSTTFNMPKLIKGTINVNVPHRVSTGDGVNTCAQYIDVTVSKNTTVVANMSGATMNHTGGTSSINDYYSLVPVVVPLTSFKKGDTLKVKCELYAKAGAGGTAIVVAMGHDPAGRVPSSIYPNSSTKLMVNVPFVIDL